jgi:hypothetical protein
MPSKTWSPVHRTPAVMDHNEPSPLYPLILSDFLTVTVEEENLNMKSKYGFYSGNGTATQQITHIESVNEVIDGGLVACEVLRRCRHDGLIG